MSYQPKSNRKFYATALTTAVVASAVAPAAVSADHVFTDVEDGQYYSNAVQYLADNTILQGPGDGTFNPDGEIIRASAAEVLAKAKGLTPSATENFSDVDEDEWFYNAVRATSPAIFEGNNGEFSPQDKLTREQAAATIVRAYNLTGDTDHNFSDVKEGSWAEEAIAIAAENGIIKGNGSGEFMPKDNVTRKDFAVMVYRALEVVDSTEVIDATTINVTLSNGEETVINLDEALVDGENEVTFTIDDKEFTVTVNYEADTEAPELTVEGLEDDSTVQESTVTFTAEATDNEDEEVTPVVTLGEEVVEANEDGSYTVELEEGENTVTVTAVDEAGNETVEDYTVTYDATVANATLAVEAYEDLTVETYADYVEATEALQAAEEALELVEDEEVTAELQARLDAQTEAVDTALAEVVDSVNNASNQVELNDALSAFFSDVDSNLVDEYQDALDGSESTVEEIQTVINEVNEGAAIQDVVDAVNAATNEVELLTALEAGAEIGAFTNVREDYITTYAETLLEDGVSFTQEEIQTELDNVTEGIVTAAEEALANVEAAPSDDALLQDAVDAVNNVPSDLEFEDEDGNIVNYLDSFQERLGEVTVVNDVLNADSLSQVRLLESLNENGFENVSEDLIADYDEAITGDELTIEDIQNDIDLVNAIDAANTAVDNLVNDEGELVADQDAIDAAQDLVDNLEEAGEDTTDLQASIDDAQDLLNFSVIETATSGLTTENENGELVLAEGVTQEEITAAQELLNGYTGDEDTTDLQNAIDAAQDLLDAAALEEATEAINALTNAEGELVADQDAIDAAQELLNAYDGDEDTTDLQNAIDAAQDLLDAAALEDATEAINALTNDEGELVADQDTIDAAQDLLDAYDGDEDTTDLQAAIDEAQNQLDTAQINAATTAEELQPLLVELEEDYLDAVDRDYSNLTSTQRLEVADRFLVTLSEGEFENAGQITAALDTEVADYEAQVKAVNDADTINATDLALEALNIDEYEALSAAEQLEVAENVMNNQPDNGYTSISEIVANF